MKSKETGNSGDTYLLSSVHGPFKLFAVPSGLAGRRDSFMIWVLSMEAQMIQIAPQTICHGTLQPASV